MQDDSSSVNPTADSEHIRSIILDLLLTLLTCGLFNIYVQYVQMEAINAMLGRTKYSFLLWALFTIITCGLYHIYHEYRKTVDICQVRGSKNSYEPLISVVLAVFGLSILADAIQQSLINRYYGDEHL